MVIEIGNEILFSQIPLSLFVYQYLDKKLFEEAYDISCLGVADSDWLSLGTAALDNLELNVAYLAFAKIKNLRHIEMVSEIEEKLKSGEWGSEACMAAAAAATGRLREAAKLYQKAGLHQYALEMYSDLRMFDIAQEFINSGNIQVRHRIQIQFIFLFFVFDETFDSRIVLYYCVEERNGLKV